MTAGSTPVTLCRRALLGIGARASIASLLENSTEANACVVLYEPTFQQLARSAPWNCLRKQAFLTLYQAATGTPENVDGTSWSQPPTPWLYSYYLPSDCLQVRYLVASLPVTPTGTPPITTVNNLAATWVPGDAGIPFAVAHGVDPSNNPIVLILTNQPQAQVVYTVNDSNPFVFDSEFEQALVASLGVFLVPALSLNLALMDRCVRSAETAIMTARVRDGNEGLTTQDHIPDWIRARAAGTTLYPYNGNPSSYGFTNMAWP